MAELAYQVTDFAYQGAGEFVYQGSVDVGPVIQSHGFYGVSLRRKRRKEETVDSIQQDVRAAITALTGESVPVSVVARVSDEEEIVQVEIGGAFVSQEYSDTIITAIVAALADDL